jgi:hypothetical protein
MSTDNPVDIHTFCRTIRDMKKPRMGRPPKLPEERLSERLEVRAAADEKADFERCADMAEIKLSDWIRDRLKRAAQRELRAQGQ